MLRTECNIPCKIRPKCGQMGQLLPMILTPYFIHLVSSRTCADQWSVEYSRGTLCGPAVFPSPALFPVLHPANSSCWTVRSISQTQGAGFPFLLCGLDILSRAHLVCFPFTGLPVSYNRLFAGLRQEISPVPVTPFGPAAASPFVGI